MLEITFSALFSWTYSTDSLGVMKIYIVRNMDWPIVHFLYKEDLSLFPKTQLKYKYYT